MSWSLRIVPEIPWHFVGLDLGQSRDHSALAVVERAELFLDEVDFVTYERKRRTRYRVRHLERLPLGTPYPDVVTRVRSITHAFTKHCTLVMDATGVGAPVLDLLRRAGLTCAIEPVILTGGDREQFASGLWRVPKRDLLMGLRVMLEKRELEIPRRATGVAALTRELSLVEARNSGGRERYGVWASGEHDDLVIAAALACWRARFKGQSMWGTRRLV